MRNPTIFISIASFCDPLLDFTVRQLMSAAYRPDRVRLGIVNQGGVCESFPEYERQISIVYVDPVQSRGTCWARSLAMGLYSGEDFFLQIDSHTAFRQGWDVDLIETMSILHQKSPKPIMSTSPFGFSIDESGSVKTNEFSKNTVYLKPRKNFVSKEDPTIMFDGLSGGTPEPRVGFQISANFLFASGDFCRDVIYDPMLYHWGEEQSISIRSLTKGWDIYHTSDLPLFHYYKKRVATEPDLHWDQKYDEKRVVGKNKMHVGAKALLWQQLSEEYTGPFGNGSVRDVSYYLKGLGIELRR